MRCLIAFPKFNKKTHMGQSLVKNYLHIVFSTKHRFPFLTGEDEQDMHRHIAEICQRLRCPAIAVGGHLDHVHILASLFKTVSLSHLMKHIKGNSSKWFKEKNPKYYNFYWQ